jgi:hypothetical protein
MIENSVVSCPPMLRGVDVNAPPTGCGVHAELPCEGMGQDLIA